MKSAQVTCSNAACAPIWQRPQLRPKGLSRAPARSGRGAADHAGAGDGRRGGARRAVPLHRPGAILHRPPWQGRASIPGAVYDQTIPLMKSAVQKANLGRAEELRALKRLDDQARQLECHATGPTVQELIAQEWQRSPSYGGRSVYGWEHGQASAKIGHSGGR